VSAHEPELTVSILNLTYTLHGFDAIRDLKLWLDEHASDAWEQRHHPQPTLRGDGLAMPPVGDLP